MLFAMYKSIIIIVLCFANYQAQNNNCTEFVTEQLSEQCSLAKNVSLVEIHWCLQSKYRKADSLVYYYTTKKNWIEAHKAHCQSLQDTRTCLSIIQVGFMTHRGVYNFVFPPPKPQTHRVSAYRALAQHSLWGIV